MGVWYKRQRNIPERPWFKDGAVLQVYDYLEAMAYVTDGRYHGQVIRQGSCPTSRADIAEATGLSLKTIDRCLKKLVANNDIIVRGNYVGSVITICNYGGYERGETLFGTTDDTTRDTTHDTTHDTTIINIEERYKDNIISPYSPYNNEREKEDMALEIKKKYNKTFDGVLPPCIRLTMPTRLMVIECLRRFGMAAVDMVFEQVQAEKFHLGKNKTGFIANFQFIFEPKNFQQYLERAQLRIRKKSQPQQEQKPQQTKSVGIITEPQVTTKQSKEDYEREMREYAQQHPDSLPARIVAGWDRQNETSNIR